MAKQGPDEEILEFAISREVEAYYFFLALAERAESLQMQEVFRALAAEELEHKAKLDLELMKLGRPVTMGDQPMPPEGFRDDLDGQTRMDLGMSYKDMLLLGIEKEERSFRTYVNLLRQVDDEESREVLLAIAEEEVKHKLRFENEYNALMQKSRGGASDA
jgi:rubrerythrin